MSSFFTVPGSQQRKRKRVDAAGKSRPAKRRDTSGQKTGPKKQPSRRTQRDESISSSESDGEDGPRRADALEDDDGSIASEHEGETAAERRLRLAERYLDNIREEVDEAGFDAEEIDRDVIAERLKEDVAESKGRLYRHIASTLSLESASHVLFRADTKATTSVAACLPHVYTVSKDMTLIKWETQSPAPPVRGKDPNSAKSDTAKTRPKIQCQRRRPKQVAFVRGRKKPGNSEHIGHTDQILTVAASQDGKFVVTGGRDRRIVVWNAADLKPLRMFSQHREAVMGLAFRRGTNQLYSASRDRTIKLWSLDELAYIETLFGHQDEVVDIAALAQERCVSVGARDRTARLWKVVEETQLVFRGGGGGGGGASSERKNNSSSSKAANGDANGSVMSYAEGSMDRIALIDEETFVTGSDNGSICLWTLHKKKPIFSMPLAHGLDPAPSAADTWAETDPPNEVLSPPQARWITALAAVPYSDLVLSGSWDGYIRAWRVSSDKKSLEVLGTLGNGTASGVTTNQTQADAVTDAVDGMTVDGETNGVEHSRDVDSNGDIGNNRATILPGVVNDIAIIERGERGKDGLCIVAALANEHRLGRWRKMEKAKNGAVLFEVSSAALAPAAAPPVGAAVDVARSANTPADTDVAPAAIATDAAPPAAAAAAAAADPPATAYAPPPAAAPAAPSAVEAPATEAPAADTSGTISPDMAQVPTAEAPILDTSATISPEPAAVPAGEAPVDDTSRTISPAAHDGAAGTDAPAAADAPVDDDSSSMDIESTHE